MAFTVRAYGYSGIIQGQILIPKQDSKDSLFMLNQPYEFRAFALSNGTTAVTLGPSGTTPDLATILRVEVPDGQQIRYEISKPNLPRTADVNSPILDGRTQIAWGGGWSLSFIDATGT
jgi:hypothetical protein